MVELLGLSKTIIFSFQNSVKPSFFHGRIARTQQNHHFFHVKLSKTLIFVHGRIARTQQNHHFVHFKLSKTLIFSW